MIQTSLHTDMQKACSWGPAEFESRLARRYGFQKFRLEDRELVDRYSSGSIFFDLSFTNFWAWDEVFHYYYRLVEDTLAVIYLTLAHEPAAILMPGLSRRIGPAVRFLREIFAREGCPLQVDYIPEEWTPLFRELDAPAELYSDRDWSDYVYNTADFTNLEGGENKGKRRELKRFANMGNVEFQPLQEGNFDAAMEVFQKWCAWHTCEACYYGCEQKAFARIRELWSLREYYGGVVYLDGAPVAFALGETLGGCACYSFQKNTENIRGLTYYLSYHCAVCPGHPPRLNWCEDMGLEGLRENKLRYRPSEIVSKYAAKIQV